jgi:hypothetical protein
LLAVEGVGWRAIFGAGCCFSEDELDMGAAAVSAAARGDFAGVEDSLESAVKDREERLMKRSFGFAVEVGCAKAEADTGADRFIKGNEGCEDKNDTPPFFLFCPDEDEVEDE